jgi:hypothetical protein
MVRILLTSIKSVLVFIMDLLEHFPLYPIVIYFVDNTFLPGREMCGRVNSIGGVWLEVCTSSFSPLDGAEVDMSVFAQIVQTYKLLFTDAPTVSDTRSVKGGTNGFKVPQRKQHAYLVLKVC